MKIIEYIKQKLGIGNKNSRDNQQRYQINKAKNSIRKIQSRKNA